MKACLQWINSSVPEKINYFKCYNRMRNLHRGNIYFCSFSWLHLNKSVPNFQNRACFFKTIEKNTLMSLVVCKICAKWYFCADKYIKMCIYVHIFIMHMFAWIWYMHQNSTCIFMYVFVYIHMYIYILAYVYVKIWTCWNMHKCWHRCTCVHEIYVCICAHAYEQI